MGAYGFTANELRVLTRLNTPQKIQRFLDTSIKYNTEPEGDECRSPRVVLRTKKAHCIEGALFALACMRVNGQQAYIVDLAAKRDHDHVICVFKQNGRFGAISKSKYLTLQWRDPVYKSVRELCMTYFAFYNNMRGSKTMRSFSKPVTLARFGDSWMTEEDNLWDIANHLFDVPHEEILTPTMVKTLMPLSRAFMKKDLAKNA